MELRGGLWTKNDFFRVARKRRNEANLSLNPRFFLK
jgi:hypothetical protein